MFNNKAILYYRLSTPNVLGLCVGFYPPTIFDSIDKSDLNFLEEKKANNEKNCYECLREKADVRGLEIVDEVIVCEENDTTARHGWRKAVALALANEADSIVVLGATSVAPSKGPFNDAKKALATLGIRIVD